MRRMKRVYHRYEKLEEYHAGMWRIVQGQDERDFYFTNAIAFTGNADLYGEYMMSVIKEWPISCEHNLTSRAMNRQAWIGHAACCLAFKCPEDITRLAWHELTRDQQDRANAKADAAIAEWERWYLEGDNA